MDNRIQIINSYKNKNNLKRIKKKNIIIKINKKRIKFSYFHIFKKIGKYKIEYYFNNNISNISYMLLQIFN